MAKLAKQKKPIVEKSSQDNIMDMIKKYRIVIIVVLVIIAVLVAWFVYKKSKSKKASSIKLTDEIKVADGGNEVFDVYREQLQ